MVKTLVRVDRRERLVSYSFNFFNSDFRIPVGFATPDPPGGLHASVGWRASSFAKVSSEVTAVAVWAQALAALDRFPLEAKAATRRRNLAAL